MPRQIIGRSKPQKETTISSSGRNFNIDQPGWEDRADFIPGSITPQAIQNAVQQGKQGNLGPLQQLYQEMETGSTFFGGLVGMIKSGLAAQDMNIEPATGRSKEEQLMADEFAVVMEEQLKILDTHVTNKLFIDTYIRGVKIIDTKFEIFDYPFGRRYAFVPEEGVRTVPGERYRWNINPTGYDFEGADWGELLIRMGKTGKELPLNRFDEDQLIVLYEFAQPGKWDMMGAGRKCLTWWLLKAYAQEWWAEFAEVYGKPTRIARYPKNSSRQTLDEVEHFLQMLGEDAYGMFPEGVRVDLVEANRGGNITTFPDIINKANEEISIALVGQTETSLSPDSGGAGARAAVLSNIRKEVLKEVSKYIEKGYRILARNVMRKNYGDGFAPDRLLPIIKPAIITKAEKKENVDRLFELSDKGLPVRVDNIYSESGITQPQKGDNVISGGQVGVFTGFTKEEGEENEVEAGKEETEEEEGENLEGESGEDSDGQEEDRDPESDGPRENPDEPSDQTEQNQSDEGA
jgi:phage gp29-like protein